MKLLYSEYDLDIEIQENNVNVITIENPAVLAETVQELYSQSNGAEGKFILSDDNKILPLHKHINLIMDIFSLNCNEKKIISKLYQEMEELAIENAVKESLELNSAISYYMEKICEQVPYHIGYQTEILPSMLMKMVELKFETEAVNLLERIIEYLGIVNKINQNTITIFINLKLFLTVEEIQSLYEYVFYNKISLVLIEGADGVRLPAEKVTIIDVDKCTIKL